MGKPKQQFQERVVKMEEFRDGKLRRTFYCIYDPDYLHWMSEEPFDEEIWTKNVRRRQEFPSRREARNELLAFLAWREERAAQAQDPLRDIPRERDAA